MKHVVLIGAGQLGSRHLQALAHVEQPLMIDVVDPSGDSLRFAEQRFLGVDGSADKRIQLHESLDDIEHSLVDVAIVATTADVRAAVTANLVSSRDVRTLLLEKVLFQRGSDLEKVGELLAERGVPAWVNCPRRMYPFYSELRSLLKRQDSLTISVSGHGWGMACNAIHFVDLMAFFRQDDELVGVDVGDLAPVVLDAKRDGFKEVCGSLVAEWASGSEVRLCDFRQSGTPLTIEVSANDFRAVVTEPESRAQVCRRDAGWVREEEPVRVPLQSELTAEVVEMLILSGDCLLTPYAESAALHRPLLEAITRHMCRHGGLRSDVCPIT